MKILKQYKGEAAKLAKYTRADLQPIEGASEEVKWYILEEAERPVAGIFEVVTERIELTDEENSDLPHFFRAVQFFDVTQLPTPAIINRMNTDLGRHLDENYPLWKRQKHLSELMNGVDGERLEYIESLKKWEADCRAERDEKESELINNNQVPVLDWEPAPLKE